MVLAFQLFRSLLVSTKELKLSPRRIPGLRHLHNLGFELSGYIGQEAYDIPLWVVPVEDDKINPFNYVFESRSAAAERLALQNPNLELILQYTEQEIAGAPLWRVSMISDRHYYDSFMIPGYIETLHASALLREKRDVVVAATSGIPAVINVGSLAWGMYYSPKMEVDGSVGSDLDMELVVDVNEGKSVFEGLFTLIQDPALVEGINKFYQHYQDGFVDYFSHKIRLGKVPCSLHIIPIETIQKLFAIPQTTLTDTFTLRELRVQPKSKPPIYLQRSFSGKVTLYECEREELSDGTQITYTPGQIIVEGEQYLGLLVDKYLHNPIIMKDDINIEGQIQLLRARTVQRLVSERETLGVERSISSAVCRSLKTPKHILDILDGYERTHYNNY